MTRIEVDIPEGSSFDTVWGDTWLVDNPITMADYKTVITNRYSPYTSNLGFWGDN